MSPLRNVKSGVQKRNVKYGPVAQSTTVLTKTANYTIQTSDGVIRGDASSGDIVITLPVAADNQGTKYTIKKIDSSNNTVQVAGDGAETIDDSNTQDIIFQYDAIQVVSNGLTWGIV